MSIAGPEAGSDRPPGYPAELEVERLAKDGTVVHLRPIRPSDAPRLVAFHEALSPGSVYLRFFTMHTHLTPKEVEHFTTVDYERRLALVAEVEGQMVGVGRLERLGETPVAEVAFIVTDAFQHRGLGGLLLDALASAARHRGIEIFEAETLATNAAMMAVFAHSGHPLECREEGGTIQVRFPITADPSEGPC